MSESSSDMPAASPRRKAFARGNLLPAGLALLPRPPIFQGVVSGAAAAAGYGLGLSLAWCWRGLRNKERSPWPGWTLWVLTVGSVLALGGYMIAGVRWQEQAHKLAETDSSPVSFLLLTPPIALLVFALLLTLSRGIRRATKWVISTLEKRVTPAMAKPIGVFFVALVAWGVLSGVVGESALEALDSSFARADQDTPDDVKRPMTPLRSGSDESLVEWDTMGREGRTFVGRGPDAEQIHDLTGRSAIDPIRVYAGLASAEDAEQRAALAVDDLERAGAFERKYLLVVTTTGTGWVEPSAASGFEYVTGGDSAIVAMQYSHLASWLSFLVDAARAREAGRMLFDAVYEHWLTLPVGDRPELHVFGESLGSFGAEAAFSGEFDLNNRTSGALLVGPPNFNPLYRTFVDERDAGSREIEPIYRNGRVIRFTTDAERPQPVDQPWQGSRVLYLQHASDPVTWWSKDLFWNRPDWLEEKRGDDIPANMTWMPVVTFLQVSADMAGAFSTQPAHGHNFSGEHAAAWVNILQPQGWTPEITERLREELARYP